MVGVDAAGFFPKQSLRAVEFGRRPFDTSLLASFPPAMPKRLLQATVSGRTSMPLPDFNIDGVLPPFTGAHGPGGHFEDLSPYQVSVLEVVQGLCSSDRRKSMLRGWLLHRRALRAIGFDRGFQWVDGSFVERDKEPKDIDIVTYFRRPVAAKTPTDLAKHLQANIGVFGRAQVKAAFHVDFLYVDLDGTAEAIVNLTRYYTGLFSHRRPDFLWKGMLQVPLDDAGDKTALDFLGPEPSIDGTASGSTP